MARVTVAEVQEIFDTDAEFDQITACITSANLMVTNVCAVASVSPALGADELKEIERWLAAHFVSFRDPREIRSKTGDAEAWYYPNVTTAWGKYLSLTPYGQQAVAMDRSGSLARVGMLKGSFRAAPREDSDNFTQFLTKSGIRF